ncbi:MAG: ferritin-like domain-containing protein [Polyangiaceae bacterium]
MRITPRLIQIASLIVAAGFGIGCTSTNGGPVNAWGGCGDSDGPAPSNVTADEACTVLGSNAGNIGAISETAYGPACQAYCRSPYACELPNEFVASVKGLNPDAGRSDDGGAIALACPTDAGSVTITCIEECSGRLTQGYTAPTNHGANVSDRFAAMAFLEAVSVHAFERLERELCAHGARPDLPRDARRARRDEQRHTAMMARLARRRGAEVRLPDPPRAAPIRSLFEVVLENAVEGCVRETHGAVIGLIEADTAPDASVRKAMRSIASDECRHAELAWAVHAWGMPQLSRAEARRVQDAMGEAIAKIAARDPRTAGLLFHGDQRSAS